MARIVFRMAIVNIGFALVAGAACAARAGEPALVAPPQLQLAAQEAESAPHPGTGLKLGLPAQTDPRKDYGLPALEIVGFDFLLNRINRHFSGSSDYDVTAGSIRRNLRSSWVADNDPFKTNQLGHPYQGSMYHGFAR